MTSLSESERQIIKSTDIFSNLTDVEFDEMCRSILIERVPLGTQLLVEGDPSHSMYSY